MTRSSPWWDREVYADRRPFLNARRNITAATRQFFDSRGFSEVEPSILQFSGGNETHISAFATALVSASGIRSQLYLNTSPEFACKKLLSAGESKIFTLSRAFRNRERTPLHHPEFTMLEWYRPGLTLDGLMAETEAMVRALCPPLVAHEGVTTDLTLPFERITCAEAFARYAGLDLLASIRPDGTGDGAALGARPDESWEEAFFRILLDHVEPHLGREHASFLTHWPAPQAALARRDPTDPRVALRFELFAGGIELANAFDELTDATEQATRFAHDVAERERLYGAADSWPVDADFLAALAHGMPSGSGIALGFDRLAMLASGARRIEDVLWLGGFPYD